MNESEKTALIAELQQLGIKHSPEKILRIARKSNDQIVFLETGDARRGLEHILKNHQTDFTDIGIPSEQIPDVIMSAIFQEDIVSYQGKGINRPVYRVNFAGNLYYIAVTVGSNGYVVCANPRSRRDFEGS